MMPHEYKATCSIDNPAIDHLTFATSQKWVTLAALAGVKMGVICPTDAVLPLDSKCSFFQVDNPVLEFIRCHNQIYKDVSRPFDEIADFSLLHQKASIANEGMRYVKDEIGDVISMLHMGNVIIGERVHVGPFSSIARATFAGHSTHISSDVQIGCGCHIGHNVTIGRRTLVIDGAVIGGSAVVGSNCYLGLNCTVRGHIKIANHSMIAMGAVVTETIKEPGFVWAGLPAKKMKKWDGSW